ncbi:uncharacterized protein PHACADRAFT_154844 [Phanerochaete carnosa HHB-10118-sp]|uniref:CFEM domain-containing protein n=1 Tax=Phanerochaete carnosa (strain HHB-10118-sp) TaxID=650164 RepID=K5VQB3_PHACS|nr:uncharacterized protein PHACADRAFT_154844 [Phanerochaete carnosa HHB-10118-sp]EKM48915.1 hypothetical protein PHACADRAFT_154844 [Phanerochaete carnosa HHB-10118-sp]
MFILKTLAVLGAAVTVVYAQTASPTPTFDACTTSCLTNSASSNGCDLTNTTCLCTNSNFQQATVECLQANCSSTDLAAVLAAQSVECNAANSKRLLSPVRGAARVTDAPCLRSDIRP